MLGLNRAYLLAPQDPGLRVKTARQLLVDGKVTDAETALGPIDDYAHGGPESEMAAAILVKARTGGGASALAEWERLEKKAEEEEEAAKKKAGRS